MEKKDEIKAPLEINVEEVIRQRLPRYNRFIPRCLIRRLERTICQDELNKLLRDNFPKRDAEFCRGVIDDLKVHVNFLNIENIPPIEQSRVLFVCNHPLGGLDGMALIDFVNRHYGMAPRFIVNDLLLAIEPLSDTFIPINKHGAQSRKAVEALDNAYHVPRRIGISPWQKGCNCRFAMAKNVCRKGKRVQTRYHSITLLWRKFIIFL